MPKPTVLRDLGLPFAASAAISIALGLCFCACLPLRPQLSAPVEDHRVQTATIAEACRSNVYDVPCSADLQDDLDAMAKQAELLDKILKGEGPK